MSKLLLACADSQSFEEVPQAVFKLRDKILNSEGTRRYNDYYVFADDYGNIDLHLDQIDTEQLEAITRYIGIKTENVRRHNIIGVVPDFVPIRTKRNGPIKMLNVKTGDVWRKS